MTLRSGPAEAALGGDIRIEVVLASGQRERIARGVDAVMLRSVLASVRPGSEARIEVVLARGSRLRIARGVNEADLLSVLAAGANAAEPVVRSVRKKSKEHQESL